MRLKFFLIVFVVLIFIISIQLFLLFNSRFTVWPEMILYPWLMNHDYLLYRDIINPYFPLLSIILDFYFKIAGVSVINLKILTYTVIVFCDLVVFWVSWKLSKNLSKSLLAVFIYILLQYSLGGNGLWFELFLSPFLVLSIYGLQSEVKKPFPYFGYGIFLMVAILIKQNTALFLFPAIFFLISTKNHKGLIYFLVSGFLGVLFLSFYLSINNLWIDFYRWALLLPLSYGSQNGFVLLPTKKQFLLIFILNLPVIVFLLKKNILCSKKIYWASCFLLATFFAFPRYEDFHLQTILSLSAIFTIYLSNFALIAFLLVGFLVFSKTIIKLWNQSDRFIDRQTLELSNQLENCSSVYLLNSPDLTYYFADKLPPRLWAINFPWYFEQEGFEERFITNLKKERTSCILVGGRIGGNEYDLGNYYPKKLYEYITKNYKIEKRIDTFNLWKLKDE